MKGFRTVFWNLIFVLVTVAGIVLQYLGQLGLEDRVAAFAGMGLTVFTSVANLYLRKITTTPVGEKY